MKIFWTQESLDQLFDIEEYISRDSPERAARFVNQLIEHGELLAENPRLGRKVPEVAQPAIRELLFKKYRIVYRLNEESIEILTVFEGHMLLRIDETDL